MLVRGPCPSVSPTSYGKLNTNGLSARCLIRSKAQDPRARTALQCFPSQPCPCLTRGAHNYLGRGMGVEQKTSFSSISSSGEPLVIFPRNYGLAVLHSLLMRFA